MERLEGTCNYLTSENNVLNERLEDILVQLAEEKERRSLAERREIEVRQEYRRSRRYSSRVDIIAEYETRYIEAEDRWMKESGFRRDLEDRYEALNHEKNELQYELENQRKRINELQNFARELERELMENVRYKEVILGIY